MCGRYALFRWSPALAGLPGFPGDQQPHWNLAPHAQVLLLRGGVSGPEAASARWGLTPAWLRDLSKTPAHARAETLAGQPMFREPLRLRRGLLPANGFYEWRGAARKRPYWMSNGDSLMYFAALWEVYPVGGHEYLSVALITQAASALRRPLLLDEQEQALWLSPATSPEQLATLLAKPQGALRERALATFVNDPKLDAPECLTPA